MKRVFFTLLHAMGLTRLAAWINRRRVVFICYHGVTERAYRGAHDPHGLHVPAHLFERQLDYLARRHSVVTLGDYLAARREGRRLPDYSVVLTFDDGFRNFLTAAAPRLAARGLPASVFIITDHTADEADAAAHRAFGETTYKTLPCWSPADDRTYLSWSEVQALAREYGFEIGSHTCTHPCLPALSPSEAERELRDSLASIAARAGQFHAPALAYPMGEYSGVISRLARSVGYSCALTDDGGANSPRGTDPYALGRTLIGDSDDVASFAVRVSGLRDWLVRLSSAVAPRSTPARIPTAEPQQETCGLARRDAA